MSAVKRRAHAHHRSLQGELLVVLGVAARRAPPPEPPAPLRLFLSDAPGTSSWSREDICDDDVR